MKGNTLSQENQQRMICILVFKEIPYVVTEFVMTNVTGSKQTGPHTACSLRIFVHVTRQKKSYFLVINSTFALLIHNISKGLVTANW